MRTREPRVVLTFATTTAAIAMERLCLAQGLPGRLIPVPTSITAGCGMAWMAPPAAEPTLRTAAAAAGIGVEAAYRLEL